MLSFASFAATGSTTTRISPEHAAEPFSRSSKVLGFIDFSHHEDGGLQAESAAPMQVMMPNEFPFHVNARPSRTDLERKTSEGAFGGPDHASFWVQSESEGRVGLVILEDLLDDAPLFDLRLSANARGRG